MDVDGFRRAEQLFHDAVALPPAEREAFVDSACAGDATLAKRVKRMITFAGQGEPTGGLLDRGPMNGEHSDDAESESREAALLINRVIGNYRIIDVLGEGGFGTVYKAEQQQPVQRLVALKMLKSGMDSRRVIARFDAERQALSVMEHPNVARVFDAGQTDPTLGSRPFFVMELVSGEPITDYCDRRRLDDRARLELLITVCLAVQHAHHKGIIHRDLKPSNILVSEIDGIATPKVIDFGIAKAVHSPLIDNPLVTQRLELLGTPQYMSPEQADPDAAGMSRAEVGVIGGAGGAGIDTRSDIYSLGVVLYELLTGTTPLDGQTLRTAGPMRMQALIRELAVEKPSTRLTKLKGNGSDVATKHNTDSATLRRRLRGDLDWITLKALEHDRERRYSSAAALADDIQRHLHHEPVLAGPPTAAYRVRKFVRRNRIAVIAASLIMLALIGGGIGTVVGLMRARDAAAQASAVNDFMREILTSVDPDRDGADVRLVEVLGNASRSASARFAGQPTLEAEVRSMLAEVYTNLSLWDQALDESKRALELNEATRGPDDVRTLDSQLQLAQSLANRGSWRAAAKALNEVEVRAHRVLGDMHPTTINAHRGAGLAKVLLGDPEGGRILLREAYARAERLGGHEEIQLAALNALVRSLQYQFRSTGLTPEQGAEFRQLAGEFAERTTRRLGPDTRPTMIARLMQVRAEWANGEFAAAADQCRDILRITQTRYEDCHSIRSEARTLLALSVYRLGDAKEAARLTLADVTCVRTRDDAMSTLSAVFEALPLLQQGGLAIEGEAMAREALHNLEAMGGGHETNRFAVESYLADFVSRQGRLNEAQTMFDALFAHRADIAKEPMVVVQLLNHHAGHLMRRGEFEASERELNEAAGILGEGAHGTWDTVPDDVAATYVALYDAWGKPEQAQKYRQLQAAALARSPLLQ